METKEKKPTWTDVKKVLSEMRREELINTIGDLYKLRKENKQFLNTRFKLNAQPLQEQLSLIYKYLLPIRFQNISVLKARKVISDYKKATGDMYGVAYLTVFYVESCYEAIEEFPMEAPFCDSAGDTWIAALKMIKTLPREQYIELWETLELLRNRLLESNDYTGKYMEKYMLEYSPYLRNQDKNDLDPEEDRLKPGKNEDMW